MKSDFILPVFCLVVGLGALGASLMVSSDMESNQQRISATVRLLGDTDWTREPDAALRREFWIALEDGKIDDAEARRLEKLGEDVVFSRRVRKFITLEKDQPHGDRSERDVEQDQNIAWPKIDNMTRTANGQAPPQLQGKPPYKHATRGVPPKKVSLGVAQCGHLLLDVAYEGLRVSAWGSCCWCWKKEMGYEYKSCKIPGHDHRN